MNMRIENGRPIFYGEPVNMTHTSVTGTEDVEAGGKTFHQVTGEKTQFTLTASQMNAIGWTIDDSMNQPHWKQLENVKDMFYYGAGGSSRISEDIQSMKQSMANLADSFFDGDITEEQLAEKFHSLAGRFMSACSEKQYPFPSLSGFEEAELSFAYDCFRGAILKSAAEHNNAEGKSLCSKYNNGWHYYNAGYYYKSESAIAAISGKAKDMAAEKGFDQFEIPDYKALGRNSLYNFNSAVSGESDYIPGGLQAVEEKWILDFDAVPPEGFKWFYEAEGRDEEAAFVEGDDPVRPRSAVWAMYKDMLISNSFDFSPGHDQPSDIKNLADLLQFRPAGRKELAAVNKLMKGFRVAPRGYYAETARRETQARIGQAGWDMRA